MGARLPVIRGALAVVASHLFATRQTPPDWKRADDGIESVTTDRTGGETEPYFHARNGKTKSVSIAISALAPRPHRLSAAFPGTSRAPPCPGIPGRTAATASPTRPPACPTAHIMLP